MKKTLTKLLCALIVLTLLPLSTAAFAQADSETININIGGTLKSITLVPASELDVENLYINEIPYKAQCDDNGNLIMYAGDMLAAVNISEAVEKHNAKNPDTPFDTASVLKLTSGETIESTMVLPEANALADALEDTTITPELCTKYTESLSESLNSLYAEIQKTNLGYATRIYAIKIDADCRPNLEKCLQDIYVLMHDMRAAISGGALSSDLLENETVKGFLADFRSVLTEIGMDMESLEFWDKDVEWVIWDLTKHAESISIAKSLEGKSLDITDVNGVAVKLGINNVWDANLLPAPSDAPSSPVL